MKLTKGQILILRLAEGFGGSIHVFSDQREVVDRLEANGLMIGDKKRMLDRRSTITDAGRRALAEAEGK